MPRRHFTTAILTAAFTTSTNAEPVQWTAAQGGNNNIYEFIAAPDGISWFQARADALARGGHLATITSAAENDFVFSLIQSNTAAWNSFNFFGSDVTFGPWLGAFQPDPDSAPDEGWQWVTGEAFEFTNWAPFDPNDLDVRESYLAYGASDAVPRNTWFDRINLPTNADPFTFPNQTQVTGYILETVPAPAACLPLALLTAMPRRRR